MENSLNSLKISAWRRVLNTAIDSLIIYFLFTHYGLSCWNIKPSIYLTEWYLIVLYLSFPIGIFLYFFIFEAIFNYTPGKFLTQTIVVTKKYKKPSLGRIFDRAVWRMIPFNIFFIFNNEDELIYEETSGTIVVTRKKLRQLKALNTKKDELFKMLKLEKQFEQR